MKKRIALVVAVLSAVLLVPGCSEPEALLSSKRPVNVTIWHDYDGAQKIAFDNLLKEFNDTEGLNQGVHITALGFGDMHRLKEALLRSANGQLDSNPLPDIFTAASRTAIPLENLGLLVDLDQYFTAEEQAEFISDYLEVGYAMGEGLKMLPVARTTDIGLLNKTDFDRFLQDRGAEEGLTYEDLQTFEGIVRVAQAYYRWTDEKSDAPYDGKAFYAVNAVDYMMLDILAQMGEGAPVLQTAAEVTYTKEMVRKFWNFYYVGIVRGYCLADGRGQSKQNTGEILYLMAPTSLAASFPQSITPLQGESYPVEMMALPTPRVESGSRRMVQQGLGMCITRSDEKRQAAAAEFMRWFTQNERNVGFTVYSTGYMPVKEAGMAQVVEMVERGEIRELGQNQTNLVKAARAYVELYHDYELVFARSYESSQNLRDHILSVTGEAAAVRAELEQVLALGDVERYEELLEQSCSNQAFERWYGAFDASMREMVGGSAQ